VTEQNTTFRSEPQGGDVSCYSLYFSSCTFEVTCRAGSEVRTGARPYLVCVMQYEDYPQIPEVQIQRINFCLLLNLLTSNNAQSGRTDFRGEVKQHSETYRTFHYLIQNE